MGDSDAESVATTGSGDSASFLRWLWLEGEGGSNKTSGYPLSRPPSTLSIDDALDDSGQQAKHDTGSTCVQRIDVGPSISQKCASDNCKYAEMVQISQQLYCALSTAGCGAMGGGRRICYHDHGHGLRAHETKSSDLVKFPTSGRLVGGVEREKKRVPGAIRDRYRDRTQCLVVRLEWVFFELTVKSILGKRLI